MDKIEIRSVVKFFFLEGKTAREIHERILPTLGPSCPSYENVRLWVNSFQRERTSIEDALRPEAPKKAIMATIIDKIHTMVLADRRIKVRELAEATGISIEQVNLILHNELFLKKLYARKVLRLLTPEQKQNRIETSVKCLKMFKKNPTDFLQRFVTMNETWIHYTPETKQQSEQCTAQGESATKKAKCVLSTEKVMALVFWDVKGILLIDYLKKEKTITTEYYVSLLEKLKAAIAEKRPEMDKEVLFHHDNAPLHSNSMIRQKLTELQFQMLPHSRNSPDLAPSDYHLFPKLKIFLTERKFGSIEEVIQEVNAYFEGLEETHFREGITNLEERWKMCIALQGAYIEK